VLWVGLEGKELEPLAIAVDDALEEVGFSREEREFMPHLTIGRWRGRGSRPDLLRYELERHKEYDFGESWVYEIILFQSTLSAEGAVYRPLTVVRLNNQLAEAAKV
jgi:2'-5' RNA ligase